MPNLQWRGIEGRPLNQYLGEYSNGSLPAITGRFRTAGGTSNYRTIFTEISGAFYGDSSQSGRAGTTSEVEAGYRYLNMDAARSSSTYWRTDNEVHTKHVGMYYCIKY